VSWISFLAVHTVVIWAIFSSRVIRARRSATRCSTGSEAFQYGASVIGRAVRFDSTLSTIVGDKARSWKLGASLFAAFGGLALLIAAVGLYSVVAYSVTQRMHEMGVRVAMGARSSDLARLIVGEGIRVVVPGMCLGLVSALVAGRRIAPLLFNVAPTDPTILTVVVVVLLVTAGFASLIPALRAAHVDPNDALRD